MNADENTIRENLKKTLIETPGKGLGERMERLYAIIEILRKECPWDKKQTPESLLHLTIEEVYEMVHAVDHQDDQELKKELGDLFLHLCFQALLAKERNAFGIEEVLEAIAEKLIYRHPHVFGAEEASNEGEVKRNWEELKMKEGRSSRLEGIPKVMPELLRSYRMQEKAASVGFDWKDASGVIDKLHDEIRELKSAGTEAEKEDEFGDILFTLVNYSRFIGVNPENALRKSNEKFFRRFQALEKQVSLGQKPWAAFTADELDGYWNDIKQQEQNGKRNGRP